MLVKLLSLRSRKPETSVEDVPPESRNQLAVGVLFLAIVPLMVGMFAKPDAATILMHGGLIALFTAALCSISIGLKSLERYDGETEARRPKYPFKIVGAGLLGLTAAILTALEGGDIGQVFIIGLIAAALTLVSFGLDPLKAKGLDTQKARTDHKLLQQRDQVEGRLAEMRNEVFPVADSGLVEQLDRFIGAVVRMLDAVADDPERNRSLQKYLGDYLNGAIEASARFVAIYSVTADPVAHASFGKLLGDLAAAFDKRSEAYVDQDLKTPEVQNDFLNESIAQERYAA